MIVVSGHPGEVWHGTIHDWYRHLSGHLPRSLTCDKKAGQAELGGPLIIPPGLPGRPGCDKGLRHRPSWAMLCRMPWQSLPLMADVPVIRCRGGNLLLGKKPNNRC
jgi:hypothetical protein